MASIANSFPVVKGSGTGMSGSWEYIGDYNSVHVNLHVTNKNKEPDSLGQDCNITAYWLSTLGWADSSVGRELRSTVDTRSYTGLKAGDSVDFELPVKASRFKLLVTEPSMTGTTFRVTTLYKRVSSVVSVTNELGLPAHVTTSGELLVNLYGSGIGNTFGPTGAQSLYTTLSDVGANALFTVSGALGVVPTRGTNRQYESTHLDQSNALIVAQGRYTVAEGVDFSLYAVTTEDVTGSGRHAGKAYIYTLSDCCGISISSISASVENNATRMTLVDQTGTSIQSNAGGGSLHVQYQGLLPLDISTFNLTMDNSGHYIASRTNNTQLVSLLLDNMTPNTVWVKALSYSSDTEVHLGPAFAPESVMLNLPVPAWQARDLPLQGVTFAQGLSFIVGTDISNCIPSNYAPIPAANVENEHVGERVYIRGSIPR